MNPFKRTNFDRAMVVFLRCLQELAEFATTTDRAALADQETVGADAQAAAKPFGLPYAIEADKINVILRLAGLLGVRMCPHCPRCNKYGYGCQGKFGSNMRPMGGVLGGMTPL